MNNVLTLKGNRFSQKKNEGKINIKIPEGTEIRLSDLERIHESLIEVDNYWKNNNIMNCILVSAYYVRKIPKSNRIKGYLKYNSNKNADDMIVGAKFNSRNDKHIITYCITREILNNTIRTSEQVMDLFRKSFKNGIIKAEEFNEPETFKLLNFSDYPFKKTLFKEYLRDSQSVKRFGVEECEKEDLRKSIVSFYDIGEDISCVLRKIGVQISKANIYNDTTVFLDEKNLDLVFSKAPYLVSMAVKDFTSLSPDDFKQYYAQVNTAIPLPENEPVIGVIDTLFEKNVYFGDWVEYHDLISSHINKTTDDYRHGTAVTSLIVDAPNLNKDLDDGCGRFRVRHFGVSLAKGFNSFEIIKQIRGIVSQNTDIKVWNLSLGSNEEINDNFVSIEGAVLDEIQFENDVIFVVAGTNAVNSKSRKKIGSPADSINSLVVNSVDFSRKPADYSRTGLVLDFFLKPDIAYYGGGNGDFINVCEPLGMERVAGTSYAAPLIARKMAYLIHIMGLSREEAKALIIDSAIPWNDKKSFEELTLIGNGIVPIKMDEILSTANDEIKFIISDISEKYNSYNYNFPVPISNQKYPYVAKATLCYFPKGSRNQGVDYTNTEFNLKFGRLDTKGIRSINDDRQNVKEQRAYISEGFARDEFRKWDNTKHIAEKFTPRSRSKDILNKNNPLWGMSVITTERLNKKYGRGVKFGVVVTLKEINGVNRMDDFVHQAQLRGWIVNKLEVEVKVNLYNQLMEDIEFE